MSNKHDDEILDPDGNTLPAPPVGTNVGDLIYLLEYGRKRGFRIGPTVKIGEVTVQVRDLRQERQMSLENQQDAPDLDPDSDIGVLLTGGSGD